MYTQALNRTPENLTSSGGFTGFMDLYRSSEEATLLVTWMNESFGLFKEVSAV